MFKIDDIVINIFTKDIWNVTGITTTHYILNNYYHVKKYKDPYCMLVLWTKDQREI